MMDPLSLRDDFEKGLDPNVWSDGKVQRMMEDHSWSISNNYGHCLKITCFPGDVPMGGNGDKDTERAEIVEKRELWLPHGTDVWYKFFFLVPKDFIISENRLVLSQIKQAKNLYSPFLSVRYMSGNFEVKLCSLNLKEKFKIKNIEKEKWHEVLVNYQLNRNQAGKTKIWLDGVMVVDYDGELGFPVTEDAIHFNLGIYRDKLDYPQTVYFAKFRRGSSLKYVE